MRFLYQLHSKHKHTEMFTYVHACVCVCVYLRFFFQIVKNKQSFIKLTYWSGPSKKDRDKMNIITHDIPATVAAARRLAMTKDAVQKREQQRGPAAEAVMM